MAPILLDRAPEVEMRLMPIVYAFVIALVGGVAAGLRSGYPFGAILLGATIVAAMTGFASAVLQFLPQRRFILAATIAGIVLGLIVGPMLNWAAVLGFGRVRDVLLIVWPVAIVSGLLLSRASGMRMPSLRRRRRPSLDRPAG